MTNVHTFPLDPLDFDQKCDGSLPLETMIKPDPQLRRLLQDIDRSKARVWALTNAYRTVRAFTTTLCYVPYNSIPNSTRNEYCIFSALKTKWRASYTVITLTQISAASLSQNSITTYVLWGNALVASLTRTDLQAMRKAGITDPGKCFFIDDSRTNVAAALNLGWRRVVHFCEQGLETVEGGKAKQIGVGADGQEALNEATVVNKLEDLRVVWADVFKPQGD